MNRRDFIAGVAASPIGCLLAEPVSLVNSEWPCGTLKGESIDQIWARILPELLDDMLDMIDGKPGVSDLIT